MNWKRLAHVPLPGYERRPRFLKFSLTVALPLQALLLCEWFRSALNPLFEAPFAFAVVLISWFCGPLHALAGTVVSVLLLNYFFVSPGYSFAFGSTGDLLRLALFCAACGLAIALITGLHKARGAIESAERMHRSLAELIPFGSWVADPHGSMQRVSESFLATFGATIEECRGEGWLDFIEPGQRQQVQADWRECMRKGYFWDYEYRMNARSGKSYVVLSRGVPLRNRNGKTTAWVGIHLDITEMERSVEERISQARDIARFNAELEQFAYISAHDLQEPLRMIASYLQLLERRYKGKLDADADTYIGFAVEGAERMRALLQDVLLLQQIGKRPRPKTFCELSSIVRKAVAALGESAVEDAVTWGDLPEIVCDEPDFVQLFEQLIANAVRYARPEVSPRVHVSAERTHEGWVISVSDNGIGIAPEYRTRIFQLFQRLHSRAEYPGTGIGLSIAKKIVEVHGGRIWVEPSPEGGSTFKFTVPS